MAQLSVPTGESKSAALAQPPGPLPAWYPAWAEKLANLYFSGTTCVFVLHGNVHDLVRLPDGEEDRYCALVDFLVSQVFGRWDIVLGYDLSRGLRALAGDEPSGFARCRNTWSVAGESRPTGPAIRTKCCLGFDAFIERNLLEEPANRKSVALIFDYAQFLIPTSDLDSLAKGARHGWCGFCRGLKIHSSSG